MRLDLATRTLYSEFQEMVFARTALQAELAQTKTFVAKTVKGTPYWYTQYYERGIAKQQYFGKATPENNQAIEKARKKFQADKTIVKNLAEQEARLAAMLHRAGLPTLDRRVAMIIKKLADAKLIDQGGCLAGTLAFAVYGGMLGILFEKQTLQTQDVDVVGDKKIELVAPEIVNADELFLQSNLRCRAIPALSPKSLPASFITEDGVRIDLLIPMRGKPKENTLMPNLIGAGATPLRFLDFLVEETVRSILITPSGGVAVQVPAPARYAIHKLIVAAYRPITEAAKKKKDLRQAEQLINILKEEQPTQLKEAYQDACGRGKKWKQAIQNSGVSVLPIRS